MARLTTVPALALAGHLDRALFVVEKLGELPIEARARYASLGHDEADAVEDLVDLVFVLGFHVLPVEVGSDDVDAHDFILVGDHGALGPAECFLFLALKRVDIDCPGLVGVPVVERG